MTKQEANSLKVQLDIKCQELKKAMRNKEAVKRYARKQAYYEKVWNSFRSKRRAIC
jgi:hypothetical protein